MPDPRGEYDPSEIGTALRAANGVVKQAAEALGCYPSTVYKYARQYDEVQQALEESRKDVAGEAEERLIKLMRDPKASKHYNAIKDVLRNYHPDDWSDKKTEQEHSGDGLQVNINAPDDDD